MFCKICNKPCIPQFDYCYKHRQERKQNKEKKNNEYKTRQIKIPCRNQRNIDRIGRWLDIGFDLRGMLWKKGVCIGYKTHSKKYLIFNFYK